MATSTVFADLASEEVNTRANVIEDEAGLSLDQCIAIAMENSPDIAQKKWNEEAALAGEGIARAQLRPLISFSGEVVHHIDEQRLIKPRRPGDVLPYADDTFGGSLTLSVPLYTGYRLENKVLVAKFTTKSTGHLLARSRRELVFNVTSVFFSILGRNKVIDSLIFSKTALTEHHKRAIELLAARKAARVDLLRTEVRLADLEQRLLRERNVIETQRLLLTSLLGLEHSSRAVTIVGELENNSLSEGEVAIQDKQLLGEALFNRRDYQALLSKILGQQRMLAIAKAGKRPNVVLQASYGNRWALGSVTGSPSDSEDAGQVDLRIGLPLFEGGRTNSEVRQERARLKSLQEAKRSLRLRIKLELETAASNIESTRARIGVTQKAVEQAKESLRIEQKRYKHGKGAIVDVLDAQSALLDSQTNYFRALADYNTAFAQLKLARGDSPYEAVVEATNTGTKRDR